MPAILGDRLIGPYDPDMPLTGTLFCFSIEEGYKPTDFQSPPDYGTKNCTFFLHPVIEYYSFGELRDLCQLQVSLVVRFNGPPLPQWPTVLNKNVLKNFINKYVSMLLYYETCSELPNFHFTFVSVMAGSISRYQTAIHLEHLILDLDNIFLAFYAVLYVMMIRARSQFSYCNIIYIDTSVLSIGYSRERTFYERQTMCVKHE